MVKSDGAKKRVTLDEKKTEMRPHEASRVIDYTKRQIHKDFSGFGLRRDIMLTATTVFPKL